MEDQTIKLILIGVILLLLAGAVIAFTQKYDQKDKKTYKAPTKTKADLENESNQQKDADLNDIYAKLKGIYNILVFFVILVIISFIASFFNLVTL